MPATVENISVISQQWLVEETGVPGESNNISQETYKLYHLM
jgi:hypothetical protein